MIAPKLLAYMINIPAYCSQEIRVSYLLLSDLLVNLNCGDLHHRSLFAFDRARESRAEKGCRSCGVLPRINIYIYIFRHCESIYNFRDGKALMK